MTARHRNRRDPQGGQATLEYVGMVLLVAALFAVFAAIARTIAARRRDRPGAGRRAPLCGRIVGSLPRLGAWGSRLADRGHLRSRDRRDARSQRPRHLLRGRRLVSLPVDFRDCRERRCADTVRTGSIHATQTGLPTVAFTHVIDCRRAAAGDTRPHRRLRLQRRRAGHVYLQYWLYYPDSLTHGLGRVGGFHLDDWESYQVKVDPETGEAEARASSHHGYNGREGDRGVGTTRGGRAVSRAGTRSSARSTWRPEATRV